MSEHTQAARQAADHAQTEAWRLATADAWLGAAEAWAQLATLARGAGDEATAEFADVAGEQAVESAAEIAATQFAHGEWAGGLLQPELGAEGEDDHDDASEYLGWSADTGWTWRPRPEGTI
jgi:hypothetical protein